MKRSNGEPNGDRTAERWQALLQRRDTTENGQPFLYGVTSTGVYCRPSCASRRPKRENTRFFESLQEAEEAGFRACLRCRPRSPDAAPKAVEAAWITEICHRIDTSEERE